MKPVFIIAEVGMAHDGSLGVAHAFIDAVADTGVDAIKYQTHIAEAESTDAEPFRVNFSYEDVNRFSYWKRTQFTREQWQALRKHSLEKGLEFMSTPFSLEAVELLKGIGVQKWKVGSAEASYASLIDTLVSFRQPIFLSTGLVGFTEIEKLVKRVQHLSPDLTLMQCTTMYPSPPERVGLNVLQEFRERYSYPVGLSDHSGTIFPGLASVALGASAVEVHVTLSENMFGPDVQASLTIENLKNLVTGIRFLEKVQAYPVDKEQVQRELVATAQVFSRSCYAGRNLTEGDKVCESDIVMKKAGNKSFDVSEIVGKRLNRDIVADTPINKEDVE